MKFQLPWSAIAPDVTIGMKFQLVRHCSVIEKNEKKCDNSNRKKGKE